MYCISGNLCEAKLLQISRILANRKIFIHKISLCVGVACYANKCDREMALFRYFYPEEKQENPFLPDPTGPLSIVVPSSTIKAANKAVKHVLDDGEHKCTLKRTHGQYETFSAKEKATIVRYATEIGVTKATRKKSLKINSFQLGMALKKGQKRGMR